MSVKRAIPLVPRFTHRPRLFQKLISAQAVASDLWAKISSWSRKLYLKLWAAVVRKAKYRPVSEVISTYVYKTGLLGAKFSYTTAIDVFNSVINCTLLLIVNKISSKVSETSLF